MNYPPDIEKKIGFDKIRTSIKDLCISPLGEYYVDRMQFSRDFSVLRTLHRQTQEFLLLLQETSGFPVQNYYDLRPELNRIRIEGTYLPAEMLFDLRSSLETILALKTFVLNLKPEEYSRLQSLARQISVEDDLLTSVQAVVDEKGRIKSSASPALEIIRRKLTRLEEEIGKTVRTALLQAKKAGWTDDDAEVVLRNGRLLIPVKASHKRKIKGFVHDKSGTGQTFFIEPVEVFDMNNEIRELKNDEREEIIRILKEITARIRPHIPVLEQAYRVLGIFDFIRAKSLYAKSINAVLPETKNRSVVKWYGAVHPLLFFALKAQNKTVVPLNIELNEKQRILIISGPNAGGKSVSLKTIGLLQYMFQSGLLVPVNEDSTFGIFKEIFIDIGDEQSIENDLSTYSSHLKNMAFFVRHAGRHTLFLIDEFGTGTEPQLGGAIAEAVLEHLNEKKAFGVVTTHYANLKLLASKHQGIVNAAMLFDRKILSPTYQLITGKPGSSFAFEIAGKTGLPKHILTAAKAKINNSQLDFESELQQLEVEKEKIKKEKEEMLARSKKLKEAKAKYEERLVRFQDQRQKLLNDAKEEAGKILANANKLIEKTIAEIKKAQAEKEKTKTIRKTLAEEKEQLLRPENKTKRQTKFVKQQSHRETGSRTEENIPAREFRTGDFVKVKESGLTGEIIEFKGKEVILAAKQMKFKVPKDSIVFIDQDKARKKLYPVSSSHSKLIRELNEKANNFSRRLDIRGKRGKEAMDILTQYIDDAIVLKIPEVEIIHGKGDGILRQLVREHLRKIPEIESFHDQHIERGGSGITVVKLKM